MDSAFAIKSSRSDAELAFVDYEGDYFTVVLRGSEVSAACRVWGYTDCGLLVGLLQHLARQDHGWKEPLEWSLIESDFRLSFRSDSSGHVYVDIELMQRRGEEDWSVKATIQTELGQLPRIAADATDFFQTG